MRITGDIGVLRFIRIDPVVVRRSLSIANKEEIAKAQHVSDTARKL
jgi:hypothetical protein